MKLGRRHGDFSVQAVPICVKKSLLLTNIWKNSERLITVILDQPRVIFKYEDKGVKEQIKLIISGASYSKNTFVV